jgi:hypothetical protein
MAISETLSSTWSSPDDWPEGIDLFAVRIAGAGSVEYRLASAQPSSNASGVPLAAGGHFLQSSYPGHKPWFRVTSGAATLYYEPQTGFPLDVDVIGYAYDDGTTDDFEQAPQLWMGFDDSGAATTEFAAYLITDEIGLGAADGVYNATLVIATLGQPSSRTFRVYGLEYATSQAASVTSLTALQGLTKTAAYAEATTNAARDLLYFDITGIVEELQGVTSWATTSPIQLMIEDTGTAATGLDKRTVVDGANIRSSRIEILMDDGSSLTPSVGTIP